MAKENGRVVKVLNAITTKVTTLMIRNMVLEYFNGRVVIVTKESIKTTKEMDMEK